MTSSEPARVLVVTDRAEATPELLDSIRGRATRGPAEFHVLVPNPAPAEWHPAHPERHDKVAEAGRVLASALPLIDEAVGTPVDGVVSIRHDPMDAIEETLHDAEFDEIILFTAPHRIAACARNGGSSPPRVREARRVSTATQPRETPATPECTDTAAPAGSGRSCSAMPQRARVRGDVQRERERPGKVGRYGTSDNTGYGGPGI